MDGAPACPFVAFGDDRDGRSTSPDHRHRCFAESPPAPRALAHQEAYCLSSAFPVCPTFQDWARREAAHARGGGERAETAPTAVPSAPAAAAAGLRQTTRTRWTMTHWTPPTARLHRPDPPNPAASRPSDGTPRAIGRPRHLGPAAQARRRGPGRPALHPTSRANSWRLVRSRARASPGVRRTGWQVVRRHHRPAPQVVDRMRRSRPEERWWLAPQQPQRVDRPAPRDGPPRPAARRPLRPTTISRGSSSRARRAAPRRPRPKPAADGYPPPTLTGRRPAVSSTRPSGDAIPGPSWERMRRYEAYPTIKTRAGIPGLPRIAVLVGALAVAAIALFMLPALLGFGGGGSAPSASPSASRPRASVSAAPTVQPEPSPQIYIVKSGRHDVQDREQVRPQARRSAVRRTPRPSRTPTRSRSASRSSSRSPVEGAQRRQRPHRRRRHPSALQTGSVARLRAAIAAPGAPR